MKISHFLFVALMIAVPCTFAGCTGANTDATHSEDDHSHDEGGHDHGDHAEHSHEEGPHGGHLIEVGGEKYHIEWTHEDDSSKLTFYILDSDAENDVPVAAEAIEVKFTLEDGDEATKSFTIPAVREGDATETAKFEIDDADLMALITAEEAEATVVAEIEGTTYEGHIEHHAH